MVAVLDCKGCVNFAYLKSFCFRYAYLEFADEKVASEMSQKYKDAEIDGEKLYVIQAISEKKEKYGNLLIFFGCNDQPLRVL